MTTVTNIFTGQDLDVHTDSTTTRISTGGEKTLTVNVGDILLEDNLTVKGAVVPIVATGTLTQANITAMNGAPVTLIAAPAAGISVVVEEIELFHDYATAAYTSGGDFKILYGDAGAVITLVDVTFVTGTSDEKVVIRPTIYDLDATTGTAKGFDALGVAATAIKATNATGAFATGNASNIIKWRIRYRLVTLLT